MRRLAPVTVLALGLALSGCGMFHSLANPDVDGYGREDEAIRRTLITGGFQQALERVDHDAPDDELLHLLYRGAIARYAGRLDESSAALDDAAAIAEDRYTKSVSRAALSTITNDMALRYDPVDAERLMIHYYGALNFLDRGEREEAAVEARRLAQEVAVLEDHGRGRAGLTGSPFLRYFTGVVFEAAGLQQDAEVSYRQAAALAGDSAGVFGAGGGLPAAGRAGAVPALAGTPLPPPPGTGEVVLLVETGFVAHREEQSINVLLGADEIDDFEDDDDARHTTAAADVTARVLREALRSGFAYEEGQRPASLFIQAPPRSERHARSCDERPHRDVDQTRGGAGRSEPRPGGNVVPRPNPTPIGAQPPQQPARPAVGAPRVATPRAPTPTPVPVAAQDTSKSRSRAERPAEPQKPAPDSRAENADQKQPPQQAAPRSRAENPDAPRPRAEQPRDLPSHPTPQSRVESPPRVTPRSRAEQPAEAQPQHPQAVPVSHVEQAHTDECEDEEPYLLRIAWPVFLTRSYSTLAFEPVVDSATTSLRLTANVSSAVMDDFEQRRALMLARTIARSAAKLAMTRGVENSISKKNEDLGRVIGILVNAGTAVLERADTRSWHMLPHSISLVRMRLPAGERTIRLRVGGADRVVTLPPVKVVPGQITFASTRLWQ